MLRTHRSVLKQKEIKLLTVKLKIAYSNLQQYETTVISKTILIFQGNTNLQQSYAKVTMAYFSKPTTY